MIEKRKLNISFLTPTISRKGGGLFFAIKGLALQLYADREVSINVYSVNDAYANVDMNSWQVKDLNIFPSILKHGFGYAPKLRDSLLLNKADVLHTHGLWHYTSIAGYSWFRHWQGKYIISPHGMLDSWALKHSRLKKWIAYYAFEKKHLENAACIHALCEEEAKAIRDFGLKSPICIIPNGVDLPEVSRSDRISKNLSVQQKKIFLYLGRIHKKKGIENLIKAWHIINSSSPNLSENWALLIAGGGDKEYETKLQKEVISLGLKDQVQFIGEVYGDDKDILFRNASSFALTSFSEGVPMAVLEAWSYGLPVLMSSACNLPLGVTAGAAIEVATTVESIAKGLSEILSMDDKQRKLMGENGRCLIKEKYSWKSVASQFLAVYLWLLGEIDKPDCINVFNQES